MELLRQNIDDIVNSLSSLEASWQDDTSKKAIELLRLWPQKNSYSSTDIANLLEEDFNIGLLICRLFLGISKDESETKLTEALGQGIGIKRFQSSREEYLKALTDLGLLEAMAKSVNYQPIWSDILVERLRSTRGKANRGQKRGRGLEDFVETIVREVFDGNYETRCSFTGANGETAKCDIAIPDKNLPRILIEAKGYGATGSKMTDVIGDLNIIVREKRDDTTLILVTDGVTWKRRLSDLAKIVKMQNQGEIARIYTKQMSDIFKKDLLTLKSEYNL